MTARTLDAARVEGRRFRRWNSTAPNYRECPEPKRAGGWTDAGLCLFHADAHKGNFRVNLDTGAFTCFACGAKGADIIAFTQLRHGLNFPDALKAIADTWGIRP